jgi:hypothetical protein
MNYNEHDDDYYYIYACEERIIEAQIPWTSDMSDIISNFLIVAKRITDNTSLLDTQASGAPAWKVRASILLVFLILGK